MKEQSKIPTGKVQRSMQFAGAGARVGYNYLKHNVRKRFGGESDQSQLHQTNANEIYTALSTLKGSALKLAQILSLDKNMLPAEYSEKFSLGQYSAPPLSYPLVVKTFQRFLGKKPDELFDSFSTQALNAASLGQVHEGYKDGKRLAVKVQYPGVADSIESDLRVSKPLAVRMFDLNEAEAEFYLQEVRDKLYEETDYDLELKRSIEISEACRQVGNLYFPTYYPELSCGKVLTMDWLQGKPLNDWLATQPSQELRNKVGQTLWDFYDHQLHNLRMVHADPHPGNFLFTENGEVGVIDFGCVKEVPEDFYRNYFAFMMKEVVEDEEALEQLYWNMGFLHQDDSEEEKAEYRALFRQMITLLGRPFYEESFDFGNDAYFEEIYQTGEALSENKRLKRSKHPRGNRHGLYINRTYYGLYNILNKLGAHITTHTSYRSGQEEVA